MNWDVLVSTLHIPFGVDFPAFSQQREVIQIVASTISKTTTNIYVYI